MVHDLAEEGFAFRLRPAGSGDSAFILSLRTDPALARFLHPVSPRIEDQGAWFREYEARRGDWYWIVEGKNGEPEGTIGLYDLDEGSGSAEWGRWVLKKGSLAAVESAYLLYKSAFEALALREVHCRTLEENRQVLSFHDSCGLKRIRTVTGAFEFQGVPVNAIEHSLPREAWASVGASMERKARRLAEMLERSDG